MPASHAEAVRAAEGARPMSPDVEARFWAKVVVVESCWVWCGHTNAPDPHGYGRIRVGGKHAMTHRLSYENYVGPIPEGLTLDHLCRNRRCVNPAHLEPVTFKENVLRGMSPPAVAGRTFDSRHRGHGPVMVSCGRRVCVLCRDADSAKHPFRGDRKNRIGGRRSLTSDSGKAVTK